MPRIFFVLLLVITFGYCSALTMMPATMVPKFLASNTTDTFLIKYIITPQVTSVGRSPPVGGFNKRPVIGPVVVNPPANIPKANLTGVIVIATVDVGKSPLDVWRKWADYPLAALITGMRYAAEEPGLAGFFRDSKPFPIVKYPVFEMAPSGLIALRDWRTEATKMVPPTARFVGVIQDDKNPWINTFKYGLRPVALFILLYSSVICVIATYKLMILMTTQGIRFNVAQCVLWLVLIGGLIRVVWSASDPFQLNGTTNFMWTQVGLNLSTPFAISGALLISLWWHELIKKTRADINRFLDKMFIPFMVMSLLLLIFEIVTSVLRGSYYNVQTIMYVISFVYVAVIVAVLAFFIITRIRLQRIFNKINRRLSAKSDQKLKLANTHFTGMIIAGTLWIVPIVIIGATKLMHTPVAFPIVWFFFFACLQTVCLFQALLIRVPYRSWKWIFCGMFKDIPIDSSSTKSSGSQKPHQSTKSTYTTGSAEAASSEVQFV